MTEKGGHRYCPNCKKIVETRVLPTGYSQTECRGVLAKRRQVICGTDENGTRGRGKKWFTLELIEEALGDCSV